MKLDLHVIQSFGPNCLNRDDTNTPKDCEFGGYKRSRVSSQCIKRAVRLFIKEGGLIPEGNLSIRTRLLADKCIKGLVSLGKNESEAGMVVDNAIKTILHGKGVDKEGKTEYLLFIGNANVDDLVSLCDKYWDDLKKSPIDKKEDAFAEFENILKENKAVDLALFGRMLADVPSGNMDAACQVAHAVSTNRTEVEYDYFTAVDDLLPDEETGAGMIGSVEFTDPCYYRYASLDLEQLKDNLNGNGDLLKGAVEAFIRAFSFAIPTGKQNSFAAQNPPSLVLAVLRDGMPWNLLNAFSNPVTPRNGGVIDNSVKALLGYWDSLTSVYGEQGTVASPWVVVGVDTGDGFGLADSKADDFETLVKTIVDEL